MSEILERDRAHWTYDQRINRLERLLKTVQKANVTLYNRYYATAIRRKKKTADAITSMYQWQKRWGSRSLMLSRLGRFLGEKKRRGLAIGYFNAKQRLKLQHLLSERIPRGPSPGRFMVYFTPNQRSKLMKLLAQDGRKNRKGGGR